MRIPNGNYIVEGTFDTGPLVGLLRGSAKASLGVDAREQRVELTPAGGGSVPAELRSGLILYLPFDSGREVSRRSDSTEPGGKVYGAKHTPSGKVGGAYEFDGFDDFVDCGDIGMGKENTRVCWFKLNTLSTPNPYLFDTGDGNNNWIELYDHDGDGKFEIRAGAGEVTFVDGKYEITQEAHWYFVAVTVDNDGKLTIYVNGEYDNGGSVTPGTPGRVCIGRGAGDEGGAGESFFDGILDEVMVFNRSLSAEKIEALYNSRR